MNHARTFRTAAILLLLTAGAGATANSQTPAPRLVVSYVEAPPQRAGSLSKHLAAYAANLRRSAGSPSITVLGETGRPGLMAVVERWDNLDPASASRANAALQTAVAGDLQSPIDRRPFIPFTAFLKKTFPATAFHMLMHVDVMPDGAKIGSAALHMQQASVMSAPGALGFEAAVQADRDNHFAVHEVWTSRSAYEAYAASAPGRNLRAKLITFKGAPFDDRFYAVR